MDLITRPLDPVTVGLMLGLGFVFGYTFISRLPTSRLSGGKWVALALIALGWAFSFAMGIGRYLAIGSNALFYIGVAILWAIFVLGIAAGIRMTRPR